MERLGVSLRKGSKAKSSVAPSKAPTNGKFKLRTTKDPPPLLTKKDSGRETKPKASFLTSAAPVEKQSKAKPSLFSSNSFLRPTATDAPSRQTTSFSFMKFQTGKAAAESSGKGAPPAFASTKPLQGKFPAQGPAKKTFLTASEATTRTGKDSLLKPQGKGIPPFSFRADTKSSTAKKRKAAESFTHEEKRNAFPSKTTRATSFTLKKSTCNKEEGARKQPMASGDRGRPLLAPKTASFGVKANDGAGPKKRSLLLPSTDSGPSLKRSKTMTQIAGGQRHEDTTSGAIEAGAPRDLLAGNGDGVLPFVPRNPRPARPPPHFVADAAKSVQLSAELPPSPDCGEECGIEEELALKALCSLDDDQEDEFLTRAAAIQDFTDRVGFEQKQTRSRLLDAHADVSECLLDALTDLMVEEGGIGIDKLAFDVNMDLDVGDAFLQDDEAQAFQ